MLKSLRKNIVAILSGLALALVPAAIPVAVHAAPDIDTGLACGSNFDLNEVDTCEAATEGGTTRINEIITIIVNIFSIVVGIVAVIMIIFGGFKYITSGGDSGNIQSAKNTIIYALIGLVVVALAQFLVQFVLDKVIAE